MESSRHIASRSMFSTSDGAFRPAAALSILNILLINLVNLLVLGLIILA